MGFNQLLHSRPHYYHRGDNIYQIGRKISKQVAILGYAKAIFLVADFGLVRSGVHSTTNTILRCNIFVPGRPKA
jgi:hypothetical protein